MQLSSILAAATAAPAYAVAPAVAQVNTHVGTYAAGPPVAHVAETYHAGPAVATTHVEHGVVGTRTIKVGTQAVQVGHEYNVVGQERHQPAPYSFVAGEAVNTQQTVALPAPALPAATYANFDIPAIRNYGPAPADAVTQERVLAPARSHTIITPQVTRIEPELHVNKYPVEVRVDVPVPVHREVLVEKRVNRPYNVEVPRAVPVPAPYKVHDVHEVIETPVVHKHTVSHHHAAPVVAAYQQNVQYVH